MASKNIITMRKQHRSFTVCQNLSLTQKLEKLAVFVLALFSFVLDATINNSYFYIFYNLIICKFKGEKLCRYLIFFVWTAGNPVNSLLPVQRINRSAIHAEVLI